MGIAKTSSGRIYIVNYDRTSTLHINNGDNYAICVTDDYYATKDSNSIYLYTKGGSYIKSVSLDISSNGRNLSYDPVYNDLVTISNNGLTYLEVFDLPSLTSSRIPLVRASGKVYVDPVTNYIWVGTGTASNVGQLDKYVRTGKNSVKRVATYTQSYPKSSWGFCVFNNIIYYANYNDSPHEVYVYEIPEEGTHISNNLSKFRFKSLGLSLHWDKNAKTLSLYSGDHTNVINVCSVNNVVLYDKPTIDFQKQDSSTLNINYNYKTSLGYPVKDTFKVNNSPISLDYTYMSDTNKTYKYKIPEGFSDTLRVSIDNKHFSTTKEIYVDTQPPTITFPQETYSKPWGYNTTIQNAYEGTDTSDTSLDYEVEHYVENVKIGNTLKTKDNTFNTNNFIPYNTETHTFLKVRALQSADTEGGTGTDIWSEWYISPTTTYTNIPEIITFKPDFLDKILLQGETKACGELFSCVDPNVQSFEVTHIINEVEDSISTIEVSQGVEGATITPPLKYHIYNPKDWQYTYQLKIRAKNSIGQYSKYYLSPKTKAEYNIAPKDPTFITKAFKDIYVVNEKFRVEWSKVTDPNGTDVTYDLALLDSEGTSLATWTKITDTFKEVVIPKVSPQTGCYFTLTAFSDRLYSSKVSSKPFAITDVNITDCNLTFPNLTTNLVMEKVNEIAIVINGDTRLIKTTNLSNYVLPLHYFRSGKNTLTLEVKDKINTVIERTWNVNLTLDKANLVSGEQPTVTGYFSFNYDNAEHFNKAVELQKSNIDLGVVEHTFLGSTPFEGSNTVTQKLEITRKANDDTTQLRTIKITGAIE